MFLIAARLGWPPSDGAAMVVVMELNNCNGMTPSSRLAFFGVGDANDAGDPHPGLHGACSNVAMISSAALPGEYTGIIATALQRRFACTRGASWR